MATATIDLGRRMLRDTIVGVGDWVYARPDGKVDLADASDAAKMPSVGYVTHIESPDLCYVRDTGPYKRVAQVFLPGVYHFISPTIPGRVIVGPAPPVGAVVVQQAGIGDPDGLTLLVNMDVRDEISIVVSAGDIVRAYAPGVLLNDAVFQGSSGAVERANATSLSTSPAIGFVVALDSPTIGQALIRRSGDVPGLSGLIAGKEYILASSDGKIVSADDTLNPDYPDTTPGSGHMMQEVGIAGSSTVLLAGPNRDYQEF